MPGSREFEGCLVFGPHFGEAEVFQLDKVGTKAWGLSVIPSAWTLPFAVLTAKAQKSLLGRSSRERRATLRQILEEHEDRLKQLSLGRKLLIRSSALDERLENRGELESDWAPADLNGLVDGVLSLSERNVARGRTDTPCPVVLQRGANALAYGHLSNERRVSKRHDSWLYEELDRRGQLRRSERLQPAPAGNTAAEPLLCRDSRSILSILRQVPTQHPKSPYPKAGRRHYEWLWDGSAVWIVQCDFAPTENGEPPNHAWQTRPIRRVEGLRSFTEAATTSDRWQKARTVKTFRECKLPTAELFVLERPNDIEELSKGRVPADVRADVALLADLPVVVRTDIDAAKPVDKDLLPRTDTCSDADTVLRFLCSTAANLKNGGVSPSDVCFLVHRFIPARSGAWSVAEPGIRRVRVDSIWGVPDGLLFLPYDAFEVDTGSGVIWKWPRCKDRYVDCAADGSWFEKVAGAPWDWEESLQPEELEEVARQTQTISNRLQRRVEVMHFIGVHASTGLPSILPWHYTKSQTVPKQEKEQAWPRSRLARPVRDRRDLEMLKADRRAGKGMVPAVIRLLPLTGLIRDTGFVNEVAEFALETGAVVELEGSTLSHVYYILKKREVHVRCVDPADPPSVMGAQYFGKLVRDRIPEIIEGHGEHAVVRVANRGELVELLKRKLVEEALEVSGAGPGDDAIEEAADVLEVLRALVVAMGYTPADLVRMADTKRDARGGFSSGIVLRGTYIRPLPMEAVSQGEFFSVVEAPEYGDARKHFIRNSDWSVTVEGSPPLTARLVVPMFLGEDGEARSYELSDINLLASVSVKWRGAEVEVAVTNNRPEPPVDDNQLELFDLRQRDEQD